MSRYVCQFSCGAASAVATKLILAEQDHNDVVIVNAFLVEEHPDNRRFLADCETWFGHPVTVLRDETYGASTDEVWKRKRYIKGPNGAPCSQELKRKLLKKIMLPGDVSVFGFTREEEDRFSNLQDLYPDETFRAPLIEEGLDKGDCLAIVERAGLRIPIMYELGYDNANCFSGDTEFLTDMGVRTLGAAVGETVRVRGAGGGWEEASIHSFGEQPLMKLSVRRNSTEKVIFATAGHRWFVKQYVHAAKLERTTEELRPGDRLRSVFGRLGARVRPSAFGIAQGIVFGDGSRQSTLNTAGTVVLCGEKDRELLRYFPLSPTRPSQAGIEVKDLPRHWKDLPPLEECQSYLYGWLAGYFAADGCVSERGDYTLSSANYTHVEFARNVAIRLGIGVNSIRKVMRRGFAGREESALYSLSLIGDTLREDFFLIEEHRRRFLWSNPREPHPWIVVSVEPTERVEEVFCAVVPEGQAFTLEGNILTGNCLGCPKGGQSYWQAIRADFPERFAAVKKIQEEIGEGAYFLQHRSGPREGERMSLAELPPGPGKRGGELNFSCSFFCQFAEEKIAGE